MINYIREKHGNKKNDVNFIRDVAKELQHGQQKLPNNKRNVWGRFGQDPSSWNSLIQEHITKNGKLGAPTPPPTPPASIAPLPQQTKGLAGVLNNKNNRVMHQNKQVAEGEVAPRGGLGMPKPPNRRVTRSMTRKSRESGNGAQTPVNKYVKSLGQLGTKILGKTAANKLKGKGNVNSLIKEFKEKYGSRLNANFNKHFREKFSN